MEAIFKTFILIIAGKHPVNPYFHSMLLTDHKIPPPRSVYFENRITAASHTAIIFRLYGLSQRRPSMKVYLIISACLLFAAGIFSELQAADPYISATLENLYDSRSFEELIKYANDLLEQPDELDETDKAEIHKYLGFSYVIVRRELEAKRNFMEWLKIEPEAKLDPVFVPPNIIRVFDIALASAAESENFLSATMQRKLDRWPKMRSIVWRSLVFPGWGHYYAGQKNKGVLFISAEILMAGSFAIAQYNYQLAEKSYYSEIDPAKTANKYENYQNNHIFRNVFLTAAILVYAGAQYDILNFELPPPTDQTSLQLFPSFYQSSGMICRLNLALRF